MKKKILKIVILAVSVMIFVLHLQNFNTKFIMLSCIIMEHRINLLM